MVYRPLYMAVIRVLPTVKFETVNFATPEPFSVPVPSKVEPSSKLTVPVGMPLPRFAVTDAVNVTLAFNGDGFEVRRKAGARDRPAINHCHGAAVIALVCDIDLVRVRVYRHGRGPPYIALDDGYGRGFFVAPSITVTLLLNGFRT